METGPVLARALHLLRTNPYGFLVTVDASGGASARLIQHLGVDDEAGVVVGTSPRSRKAADVEREGRATYAVEDRASFAYVALSGPARLVDDQEERRARWEPGLQAFFPAGPGGDDFVLLEVRPERLELVDFAGGVHPDPYGLVPAVLARSDRGWVPAVAERRP